MGNKVHPISFRLGKLKNWTSLWYNPSQFNNFLHQDLLIKEFIKNFFFLRNISISNIYIDRSNEGEIKIFLNLILIDGIIGTKLPFNLLSKKFLQLNRKFNSNYLNYTHLNNFNLINKKSSNKKSSFNKITQLVNSTGYLINDLNNNKYLNHYNLDIVLSNKVLKKSIYNVNKIKKNNLISILNKDNSVIYKLFYFNTNNSNLTFSNSFYRLANFFKDLTDLKYRVKKIVRRKKEYNRQYFFNNYHKNFFKKTLKYRNYFNYHLLTQHLKKRRLSSHILNYFFYINNFSVIKIHSDGTNETMKLFETTNFIRKKNISFKNKKRSKFKKPREIITNNLFITTSKRSNFNSIVKYLLITCRKSKLYKHFKYQSIKNKKLILGINTLDDLNILTLLDTKKVLYWNKWKNPKKIQFKKKRSFLKIYTTTFFSSGKQYVDFLNNKFNYKLNSKISFLFSKRYTINLLLNRTPNKKPILNDTFINNELEVTKSEHKKIILSSKVKSFENTIQFNKNDSTINNFLNMYLNNDDIILDSNYLNFKSKKHLLVDLIKKNNKNINYYKFNNNKQNFNLFLNERYYYFLLIRYNLPYLNKIVSSITKNNAVKWEFFINKRKNMNAQDIGNFLKKSLNKRRHQRQLLNPVDLIKNQLGDNLVYINKIKSIKDSLLTKNLFQLYYKNTKLFKQNYTSFKLSTLMFKKLNQVIWFNQYKQLDQKLSAFDLITEQIKSDVLLKTDKFFLSKLNLVKKRKNYLLSRNPIFFDNISYFYKQDSLTENKSNLIRNNNLLSNNLKNSFINLLKEFNDNKKILINELNYNQLNKIDSTLNKLINKQFIHIIRGFQVMGFGRLGSSSKSTRSNVTTYKIGKTMKNSFNLHIDYDFKTQITRNGIYGLKVAKFYQTFDVKNFVQKNCANYLI